MDWERLAFEQLAVWGGGGGTQMKKMATENIWIGPQVLSSCSRSLRMGLPTFPLECGI